MLKLRFAWYIIAILNLFCKVLNFYQTHIIIRIDGYRSWLPFHFDKQLIQKRYYAYKLKNIITSFKDKSRTLAGEMLKVTEIY